MSQLPTADRPTAAADRAADKLDPYYKYRLTVPHAERAVVHAFCEQYSKDFCYCTHFPDEDVVLEHFHFVFRDFDAKAVDRFRKAVSKHFGRAGNGLHAGCFESNHISNAVGYFKHDEHAEIFHSGQSSWDEYIASTPAFIKMTGKRKVFKESMSNPVLTYANVLKQANKYRIEHDPKCTSLSTIVEKMVNDHNWFPSRELLSNGIPSDTHQRFHDMVTNKRSKLAFWLPHEPSEKKQEWTDRVATGWYPSGVSSSGPGNSRKQWSDKDFTEPSSI